MPLVAKLGFHLVGEPHGTVTDGVQVSLPSKTGLAGGVEHYVTHGINAFLESTAKMYLGFAVLMGEANAGYFPAFRFVFALVGGIRINRHNGDHATVGFEDQPRTACMGRVRYRLIKGLGGADLLGMVFRQVANRADTQRNAVMFFQLIRHLTEGMVCTEIDQHPLQRLGTAAAGHPRCFAEGA